jgi:hypothetical protein
MLAFIDSFLDRTTMFRLLTYYLLALLGSAALLSTTFRAWYLSGC